MALKKTVSTAYGIDFIDAYHRVDQVQILGKNMLVYGVKSYKDNSGVQFFNERACSCAYDINGENPIAQAYAHLKTLTEFADAVDC